MTNSDDDEERYVPYAEREEWKDLKPIIQDDGPSPVCPIAYTEQFQDTMNYFRAILETDERSERSLILTSEAIKLNPANYTSWYFRRQVLETLGKDLKEELKFNSEMATNSPKNYQIWFHRRWLVGKLSDPSNELNFTAKILVDDAKNYHAWSHRQWVLETFNLWAEELAYVELLLKQDIRNNSAWNQRYFVIDKTTGWTSEVVDREIEFSIAKISQAPNNTSAWAYLKGVTKDTFGSNARVRSFAEEAKEKFPGCSHSLALLVDILEQEKTPESKTKAEEYCDLLATRSDQIHQKYWRWRKSTLA